MKVHVIGAGVWGTALGTVAHKAGHKVALWTRNSKTLSHIQEKREHPGLAEISLPEDMTVADDLAKACAADVLILGVTAGAYRDMARMMRPYLTPETVLVSVAKGIDPETGQLMTEILEEILPQTKVAVLSGPNFAREVAAGLPAASVLACSTDLWVTLKDVLSSPTFRLYHSLDITGVQLGGAIKNVTAIACGLLKSQHLGENAMSALICRSLAEMRRLGLRMGAQPQTFSGLSCVGDLMLTCFGSQSRNLKFGEGIGGSRTQQSDLMKTLKTVEGMPTAKSMMKLAEIHGVELPICEAVYDILYENAPIADTVHKLLSRPLKAEADPVSA